MTLNVREENSRVAGGASTSVRRRALEREEEPPVLLKDFQEQLVEEKKEALLDILDQENPDMEGMISLLKRVEDILVIPCR